MGRHTTNVNARVAAVLARVEGAHADGDPIPTIEDDHDEIHLSGGLNPAGDTTAGPRALARQYGRR